MRTDAISPQKLDLLNADTFAAGHPHDLYDRQRAESPMGRNPGSDLQSSFWLLTRHADIKAVSLDSANFSSARGFRIATDKRSSMDPEIGRILSRFMIAMDNPEHHQFRNVVASAFSPRALSAIEPRIRESSDRLLASLPAGDTIDFVTDVGAVTPIQTICMIMGIPEEDAWRVFNFTNAVFGTDDPEFAPSIEVANENYLEIFEYGLHLIGQRRRDPREDLLSAIAHAEINGRPLSDDEMKSFFSNLIAAGNETTRSSLSGAMLGLWRFPDERHALASAPQLMDNAVKELLRWYSPVIQMARTALRDVEIGGQTVAEGDRVAMLYGAGNHDPEVFVNPRRLEFRRSNASEHISFGYGVHHCVGFRLAQLQMKIILSTILTRYPDFTIESEPLYLRSNFVQAIKSLPLRLTKR